MVALGFHAQQERAGPNVPILFDPLLALHLLFSHWPNAGPKPAQIQVQISERLHFLRDHFWSLPQVSTHILLMPKPTTLYHSWISLASDLVLTPTCSALYHVYTDSYRLRFQVPVKASVKSWT